jgi:hypothetical protein
MPSLFDNGNKFIDNLDGPVKIVVDSKKIHVHDQPEHSSGIKNDMSITLLSDTKKIHVPMENAYYHLMVDAFSSIANHAKNNPGSIFLILSSIFDGSSNTIHRFFVGLKRMYDVSYLLLDPGEYEVKNLLIARPPNLTASSGVYSNDVYLAFSDDSSLGLNPYRKVYVSRGAINNPSINTIDYKTRNINHRIADEIVLENFFIDLGYEIVHAETMTIEEKVKLFAETKVIASVTSAGLANAMFMKPGTVMVELLVPIIWGDNIELYTTLYSKVAAFKNMIYFSIASVNNLSSEILSQLNSYKKVLSELG